METTLEARKVKTIESIAVGYPRKNLDRWVLEMVDVLTISGDRYIAEKKRITNFSAMIRYFSAGILSRREIASLYPSPGRSEKS